jgi:outer membrane murein-binding lipoprotein Lpp
MKKSTRISLISAAAIYAVMGLPGCASKPKTIDLKQSSDVYAQ